MEGLDRVFILVWAAESGDDGVDGYWAKEPSLEQLHIYLKQHYEEDFNCGTLSYHIESFARIE